MAMKIKINDYCTNIRKIYPFSVLLSCGKNIKIYDIRMHNELFNTQTQENIKGIEVLSSKNFITNGINLTWWESKENKS
jgi:hypothetical protein